MGGIGPGVCLLLSLAAPPAAPAPRPATPDPAVARDAQRAAIWLTELAGKVSSSYARDVPPHKLLAAGLGALYEKAGRRLPTEVPHALAAATTPGDRLAVVTRTLTALGRPDGMTAAEAFVTAADGFSRVTDPYSGLVLNQSEPLAVSEAEFGLGFEIEGATGPRWIAYLLESALHPGEPARPPVGAPWVVRRVIPGSPAAKAGLRPGDRITQLDGDEITADQNPALFRRLASAGVPALRHPTNTVDLSAPVALGVERAGAPGLLPLKVQRNGYSPESVFGVTRKADGSWDYLLDRDARIGYVRLGAVERRERPSSSEFDRALSDLNQNGAEALILDLRWCPGGYVQPITQIVGALLPPGKTITTIRSKPGNRDAPRGYYADPLPLAATWRDRPLAVLVNGETTGGGEMIAAALQDHGRAVVIGQRTFGKANIMQPIDLPLPGGIGYRLSTMYCLRPNGKGRHRFPDSKPTDDWGVRPDRGYEVPQTPDLSARLRAEAELHAIRPPGSTEAVAYDDPLTDPQRVIALRLLKEKLKADKHESPMR